MARYLLQASYASQTVSAMVNIPEDRSAVARSIIERLGGRLESFDFAFGDYDAVAIAEFPDKVSVAALSMALGASGSFTTVKTTVLISMDEAMEAMRKAGTVGYRPPGG